MKFQQAKNSTVKDTTRTLVLMIVSNIADRFNLVKMIDCHKFLSNLNLVLRSTSSIYLYF